MSVTDDRRFAILRAIVTDYVSTQEPVGSKNLVDRHKLGVSSATVRNDMAVLLGRGLHHNRTPAPDGFPPTRDTGCSSTGSARSNRSHRPNAAILGARFRCRPRRRICASR